MEYMYNRPLEQLLWQAGKMKYLCTTD